MPAAVTHYYNEAEVYVGWTKTFVRKHSASKRDIEYDFIIADASWYSLIVMDWLASLYLLDAFVGIASGKPRLKDKESRTIRLTYMDAANAAHPIRWTTKGQDLWLLEHIHRSWSSERWWANIQERTQLLSSYYNELDAESSQRREWRLTLVGGIIAAMTLTSAITDLFSLERDGKLWQVVVALGITAIVIVLTLALWRSRPGSAFPATRERSSARAKSSVVGEILKSMARSGQDGFS
jgi:hypothetical protein